jgi:hypothetical protein
MSDLEEFLTGDGGRYVLPGEGEVVRDRDGDEGDELVVVAVHEDRRAGDYVIEAIDATVAAVNRAYDRDAPVVEAVYVDELGGLDGYGSAEEVRDAVEAGAVRAYTFPADRLAAVGGEAA